MKQQHQHQQRRLRSEVFLREVIPWWLAPVGYGGLAILSIIFIPMVGVLGWSCELGCSALGRAACAHH
jgi:hypothetical protein